MPRILVILASVVAVLAMGSEPATAGTWLTLDDPDLYELQSSGFLLGSETEIRIEAAGLTESAGDQGLGWLYIRHDRPVRWTVDAWILDADTRETVWALSEDRDHDGSSGGLQEAEVTLRLGPGRYEAYLHSGHEHLVRVEQRNEEKDDPWWVRMFSDDRRRLERVRDRLPDCRLQLASPGVGPSDVERFDVTGEIPGTLVRLAPMENSSFARTRFRLDRLSSIRVYAVVEFPEGRPEPADPVWITRADTGEIVWYPEPERALPAGGGAKNRKFDEIVELEPGVYEVGAGTDDTHASGSFNTGSPHDPLNWGVTVLPGPGFDPAAFRLEEVRESIPLVEFAEVRNGEAYERAFRLDRPAALRVRALGEITNGGMADGAWISDARTERTVWTMTRKETRSAGGASKNRMFDGLVRLEAGLYRLHYAADDSHAYGDWNAAAPFLPEAWGVALYPGPDFDAAAFDFPEDEEIDRMSGVLAKLVRVGDDELRRAGFVLERAGAVRIVAVGEGDRDGMYDYGYVIDRDSGRRVWSMGWKDTEPAGGARKNRRFDGVVELPAGSYEVVFVSDGSHSFGRWNSDPPEDPGAWGITVIREGS